MGEFIEWLPRIGLVLTGLIGCIGLIKPELLVGPVGITMPSDGARSEIRAVFGGIHLGYTIPALLLNQPLVYVLIGCLWLGVTLSRLYSVVVDRAGVKSLFPALIVDAVLAGLFLSACRSGVRG